VEGREFVVDQIWVGKGLRRPALLVPRREDAAHRFLVLGFDLVLEELLEGLVVFVEFGVSVLFLPPVLELQLEAVFLFLAIFYLGFVS